MRAGSPKGALAIAISLVLIAFAAAEASYAIAAALAEPADGAGSCRLLVLGSPSRDDGAPHPVQELRVSAAVAAFRDQGCERMVLSGGAVGNDVVEAETMAALARALGVPSDALVVEGRARNTWENVGYSLAHLEGADRILIVSDSLHVLRGRRYLCRQRPELCDRVRTVGAYRPLAGLWWKLPASLHELGAWIRDRLLHE